MTAGECGRDGACELAKRLLSSDIVVWFSLVASESASVSVAESASDAEDVADRKEGASESSYGVVGVISIAGPTEAGLESIAG